MPEAKAPELRAALADELDQTLLWLCQIASPIGEEKAICDAVEARLRALPGVRLARVGDSLVAHLPTDESRPRVALVGHLDTVRTENGPAHIAGDRCFGAGASDMKSGLAVMLVLAENLSSVAPKCDLTLVFYAREEGPFAENELGDVLDRCPELGTVDLAVCMEPSDNKLHLGCNGSIHATVTFEGKTGHSSRPWEGVNAIHKAGSFLAELAAKPPRESVIDGLAYRTVTSATQAQDGGRGRNVVPDRFVVNVNHRFAPSTSLEAAKQEVLDLVAGRAHVVLNDLSPAALPNRSNPLVGALLAAGATVVEPKQAWTDVARFAAKGVAAVNFGPGENAQAHQKNESTSTGLVHQGYAIVEKWLSSM